MKILVIIASVLFLQNVLGQNRELLYSNKDNSLTLYHYTNDSEFEYVVFYKNLPSAEAFSYEYLNFKSLNDVNLFLFYTLRSMTERKSIHLKVLDQDLYIHGVSKKQAVLSIDDINGCVNKSDITELKTKLAEL